MSFYCDPGLKIKNTTWRTMSMLTYVRTVLVRLEGLTNATMQDLICSRPWTLNKIWFFHLHQLNGLICVRSCGRATATGRARAYRYSTYGTWSDDVLRAHDQTRVHDPNTIYIFAGKVLVRESKLSFWTGHWRSITRSDSAATAMLVDADVTV